MKHINIFVAGSKMLSNYRERLILWANECNYKHRLLKKAVQINIYSFNEVGDDQDVYNKVITDESDIVLFLIEGTIGDRTKEELMQAKSAYLHKKHPEVWVYVNKAEENTVAYLEGAMGRKYATNFESEDNLINLVAHRLDKYINDLLQEATVAAMPEVAVEKQEEHAVASVEVSAVHDKGQGEGKKWWSGKMLWCLGAVASVLLFVAGWFASGCIGKSGIEVPAEEHSMLLIAGGGSVANFIEENPGTSIPSLADYPNGYFVHLPTKSAWKMLVEEVVSLQDTRRYYPVCLSAEEATDEDFCNAHISLQMYLDSAIVVSAKLGEDSLAVYVPKNCKFLADNPKNGVTGQITVEQLKRLVMSGEMNVYSTSIESGTRAGYCKVLGIESDQLTEYLSGQFSENSPLSAVSVNDKPYLLLGSQYYRMNATRGDAVRLTVQSTYVKPMMVYFMAYRVTGDIYRIPPETREFLGYLNFHMLDDYISSEGHIKIKNHNHVIYDERNMVQNDAK